MGDGTGKTKKKAFIRTVKRNFLTNNINHMLCIYDESRVGSVKRYRVTTLHFFKISDIFSEKLQWQAAIFTTQAPTDFRIRGNNNP